MKWSTDDGLVVDDFDATINGYFTAFKSSDDKYKYLTYDRFEMSREYEQFYASAQIDMNNQDAAAQTFNKVIEYIHDTKVQINSPSTTIFQVGQSITDEFGFNAAVKPPSEADAGKMSIAIDYTPDDETNQNIANFLSRHNVSASIVTLGDISKSVAVSNGQSFDYKWTTAVKKEIKFKLDITVSRNTEYVQDTIDDVAALFLSNFDKMYKMGFDIAPELYFQIERDAKYASEIVVSYSVDDGATWKTDILPCVFTDVYTATLSPDDVSIH